MSNHSAAASTPGRFCLTNTPGLLVLLCRLIVGVTFVYASIDKLANPSAFAVVIANYQMVPFSLLHIMALLMPMVEFLAGSLLILGVLRRGAALLCAGMTFVFIVALTVALIRGLDISCGCFNTDGGHSVGLSLLVRDIFLLLACLPPLVANNAGISLPQVFRR